MPDPSDQRPPSSRAGSAGTGWIPPSIERLQSLLPQYEILSMLGHGGMGAVYKGKQKSLDRLVAIKILPPGLDDDDVKFTERFKNEARTMAKMNHPGIVSVYDFGETAEGQLYFIMEYVDGTDVAQMIKASGKLPPDHALAITAHVCDALQYAHSHGVVHRDIKPANILINMQGQVKIADFGLAKMEDPSMTTGLTKTGMAMGTPDFVAPEALVMGYHIDGRADLYAVGVMLYQMLTGEIPRGMFMMPGIKSKGEIDPRFDAIIAKAMQTDREMRYQTATELRRDLDVILTTPRVKQDASKVVAAVPKQAVAETPDKRSAAVKPAGKGPSRPAGPQRQSANVPVRSSQSARDAAREAKHVADSSASKPKKSNLGLYIGIGAAAAVLIGGIFFATSKRGNQTALPATAVSTTPSTTAKASTGPIKVVETPKSVRALAGETPKFSPSTEPWQDRLAEIPAWAVTREGAALRVQGTRIQLPITSADGAIRALFVPSPESLDNKNTSLVIRDGRPTTNKWYQFTTSTANAGFLAYDDNKPRALIPRVDYAIEGVMVPGKPVELELRAVGTRITASINGKVVASADDPAFTSASCGVFFATGTLVHGLQTLDLSKAAPTVAGGTSLPVITGWQDVMAAAKAEIPRLGNTEVKEDNGWLVTSNFKRTVGGALLDNKDRKDIAMRGRVRGLLTVTPRFNKAGYYTVTFRKDGTGSILLYTGNPQTSTVLGSFTMSRALEHDFLVTITGPDIRLWVDGALAATARDTAIASGTPTITLAEEGAAIRDLAVAELPADFFAKALVAATSSAEQWHDLLAEWWANPAKSLEVLSKVAGGSRVEKDKGIGPSGAPSATDIALRATIRDLTTGANLYLRVRSMDTKYVATLNLDGSTAISVYDGSPPAKKLASAGAPAGFDAKAVHTFEFRAEGDTLTMLLDGKPTGTAHDSTLREGSFYFLSHPGTLIEKLEYRELTAPVASASEEWRDFLAERAAGSSALKREASGWRVIAQRSIFLGKHRDVAVRATVRGDTASEWMIQLRFIGDDANSTVSAYNVDLRNGQPLKLYKATRRDGDGKALKNVNLPGGFSLADRHTMEVHLLGDTLTCILDGQEVASVKDDVIKPEIGGTHFFSAPGALIERLEYAVLDPRQTATAAAAEPAKPSTASALPAPPPTDPKIITLLAQYTNAVTKAAALAKPADKPAFEAELIRLKTNAPLPDAAEDAKLPAELKRLRSVLRGQLK